MLRKTIELEKLFKGYFRSKLKGLESEIKFASRDGIRFSSYSDELSVLRSPMAKFEKGAVCPSIEELGAYIDGSLDGESKKILSDHVEKCAKCRLVIEAGQESMRLLGEDALDEVPGPLHDKTTKKVSEHLKRKRRQ